MGTNIFFHFYAKHFYKCLQGPRLSILHILVNNGMLEGEKRRVWEKQTKYIFCLENVFKFLLIEKLF